MELKSNNSTRQWLEVKIPQLKKSEEYWIAELAAAADQLEFARRQLEYHRRWLAEVKAEEVKRNEG